MKETESGITEEVKLMKGLFLNNSDRVRYDHLLQAIAATKGSAPDASDRVGNHDFLQFVAAAQGIGSNGSHSAMDPNFH